VVGSSAEAGAVGQRAAPRLAGAAALGLPVADVAPLRALDARQEWIGRFRRGSGGAARARTRPRRAHGSRASAGRLPGGSLLRHASSPGQSNVPMLTRRIVACVAGLVLWAAVRKVRPQPAPPNIAILPADALGDRDPRAFGNPSIRTPRLDAMAAEGQKWTNFYVQPVCSPSRAALLTGRLPIRSGMYGVAAGTAPKVMRDNAAQGLPLDEITIAEALK